MRENTKTLPNRITAHIDELLTCTNDYYVARKKYNYYPVFQANTGIPDSSEDEGCNERIRMSYFTPLDTLELGDDSSPSVTRGKEEVKPLYAFPIWLPHLRQRSFVLRRNKPHECLWKCGAHWISSTWVNLLSSILKNDMIPRFMDFPYFDPIDVVFRFDDDRFSS